MDALADDLGCSRTDVIRRALTLLAAEGQEQIAREELEREQGADLLARIRDLGHLSDDEALGGHPVSIDVVTSRRVVVRWSGHTFQTIGDRLVVARRRLDGTVEIAYLDGPEPEEPDVAKFFAERVLV
jgi:hypothetical protein